MPPAKKTKDPKDELKRHHAEEAKKALAAYQASRTPAGSAKAWSRYLAVTRGLIGDALRASSHLTDVAGALVQSGAHMLVFRHLMAPPISQDQFKLVCPKWNKGTESAGRVVKAADAAIVAAAFEARRLHVLTPWIKDKRKPTRGELENLYWYLLPLISNQQMQTDLRNGAALDQEGEVMAILNKKGWKKLPSKTIDTRAMLPFKTYMHKTRFATATSTAQEVDIAMGLEKTFVMAMECKVSNDHTNSVKRVNDVLKKAAAWQQHWGSFVKTAALLQGVIASKDVNRLIDGNVEVFWSHDMAAFENWVDDQM